MRIRAACGAIAFAVWTAGPAFPCSAAGLGPKAVVAAADVILRVKAQEYAPSAQSRPAEWLPEKNVRFLLEEVVKGSYAKPDIILPGVLSDTDDWNRGSPPYTTARPSADAGCFAIAYREGGQFLLMLRKWNASFGGRPNADGLAVYWRALEWPNQPDSATAPS